MNCPKCGFVFTGKRCPNCGAKAQIAECAPPQTLASQGAAPVPPQPDRARDSSGLPDPNHLAEHQAELQRLEEEQKRADTPPDSGAGLGAQAFTTGNQIQFGSPQPSPGTEAHEFAHTISGGQPDIARSGDQGPATAPPPQPGMGQFPGGLQGMPAMPQFPGGLPAMPTSGMFGGSLSVSTAPITLKWQKESYPHSAQCYAKFFVQNRSMARVRVTLAISSADAGLSVVSQPVEVDTMMQETRIAMKILVKEAGEYEFDGILAIIENTISGETGVYKCARELFFKVTLGDAASGPVAVIDPFAMGQLGGGRPGVELEELPLEEDKELSAAVAASQRPTPSSVREMPSPIDGAQMVITERRGNDCVTWFLFGKGQLQFGRQDPTKSEKCLNDVVLRFLPETDPRNNELSCHISREQFVCDCSHGAPVVTCLGSTNMTVDGKPLVKGRSATLGHGGSIVIAAVMTLEYRVVSTMQGTDPARAGMLKRLMPALFDRAEAVIFRVRSQGPERGFIVINGRLPVDADGNIGSTAGAPAGYVYCDRMPDGPDHTRWFFTAESDVNLQQGVLRQSEALQLGHMTRLSFAGTLLDFESVSGWNSHYPWTQPETGR